MLEDLNACLALAVQHADEKTLAKLAAALPGIPQVSAKAQIERRREGGWTLDAKPPTPWANLPEGVIALACNDRVLSLEADDRHIYTGMPWGVAVYNHVGNPQVRVALAAEARILERQGSNLWVGTPKALFQIVIGTWEVRQLDLDHDLSPAVRTSKRKERRPTGAQCLAFDGRHLWIGTGRNVQRFDPDSGKLFVFTPSDMNTPSHKRSSHTNPHRGRRPSAHQRHVCGDAGSPHPLRRFPMFQNAGSAEK